MVYISSSYIVLWMSQQLGNKMNFILFIPLLGAFIDWIKQAIFLMKKDSKSPCCTSNNNLFKSDINFHFEVLMMSFFVVVLYFVPAKWVNLFPSFALFLPLLAKFADLRRRRKHYLNRFQICNWICASLWMVTTLLTNTTNNISITGLFLFLSSKYLFDLTSTIIDRNIFRCHSFPSHQFNFLQT